MKHFILSIDQGTTSSRVVIYDDSFSVIDSLQKEVNQFFPKNGWIEHNAIEIWNDVKILIQKILKKNKIQASEVLSIGITNQRETTVLWDKNTGKPVQNAIVWQDRRTINICKNLQEKKLDKRIQEITGLIIDPYFSATKIKWLIDNNSEAKILAKEGNLLFGTIDTWILWKLTNGKSHYTDVTNASRTMIYDIEKKNWSNQLLRLFKIPKKILPKVKPNIYNFGETKILNHYIKINGIIGDQQAALIGQGCFNKGMSKSTYGTGCFFLMNIGKKPKYSKYKLLTSIAYEINNETFYCLEGSIFVAGSAIQWLRDGIKIIKSAQETSNLFKKADLEQEIYIVPAFTGLGAPYWNQNVRGAIYGINRNTGVAEIVNATLKSIAYLTKDLINLMQKDSSTKINQIKVDGGMVNNQSFIKFLTDILNINIIKPKYSETTALGAAYLSALGSGLTNILEIKNKQNKFKIYKPNMNKKVRKILYRRWTNAVNKTLLKL